MEMSDGIEFRKSLMNELDEIAGEYLDYQEKIADVKDDEEYSKLWNESQRKINALKYAKDELERLNDIEKALNE